MPGMEKLAGEFFFPTNQQLVLGKKKIWIFADLHSNTGHLYLSLLGLNPGKGPDLFNDMFQTITKFNV